MQVSEVFGMIFCWDPSGGEKDRRPRGFDEDVEGREFAVPVDLEVVGVEGAREDEILLSRLCDRKAEFLQFLARILIPSFAENIRSLRLKGKDKNCQNKNFFFQVFSLNILFRCRTKLHEIILRLLTRLRAFEHEFLFFTGLPEAGEEILGNLFASFCASGSCICDDQF